LLELIAPVKYVSSANTANESGQEAWTVNKWRHTLEADSVMTLDRVL